MCTVIRKYSFYDLNEQILIHLTESFIKRLSHYILNACYSITYLRKYFICFIFINYNKHTVRLTTKTTGRGKVHLNIK